MWEKSLKNFIHSLILKQVTRCSVYNITNSVWRKKLEVLRKETKMYRSYVEYIIVGHGYFELPNSSFGCPVLWTYTRWSCSLEYYINDTKLVKKWIKNKINAYMTFILLCQLVKNIYFLFKETRFFIFVKQHIFVFVMLENIFFLFYSLLIEKSSARLSFNSKIGNPNSKIECMPKWIYVCE